MSTCVGLAACQALLSEGLTWSDFVSVHEGHSLDSFWESSPARPGGQCSYVGAAQAGGEHCPLSFMYVLFGLYT